MRLFTKLHPKVAPENAVRTVVQLRRLNAPVTYAESVVHYDAWGTPYAKANLYGHAGSGEPYDLILCPGGRVEDGIWNTQWRHKSGPTITFPEKVTERQARGWLPDETSLPRNSHATNEMSVNKTSQSG